MKETKREDLLEGRNSILEALKSEKRVEQIFITKGEVLGSLKAILAIAKEKNIIIKEVDKRKLDSMGNTGAHQGVIALVNEYKYSDVDEILNLAKEKGEDPFIIILDEIEDPHNLGAIIRTAEVCGAHGVIMEKRRNALITSVVHKSSAGAVEYMKIAKVTNINTVIDRLKEENIWIYGADMSGNNCFDENLTGPIALVIGSEGKGISKLTKQKCDVMVKIPMKGKITSLNASVAGGILMYEISKQRV